MFWWKGSSTVFKWTFKLARMSRPDSTAECSQSSEAEPPPKKGKWYKQNFRKAWLNDPDLQGWIASDPRDSCTTICTVCDCKLKDCNKTGLLRHKATAKHVSQFNAKKNSFSMDKFFKKPTSPDTETMAAKAEVLLAGFMAELHVPFLHADHLTEVMKKMFPDSKIAESMTMKRTKASYVMQEGIAVEESESLSSLCKNTKFSLLIDESTDISVSQVLAIVVRFFQNRKVTDALLTTVEVEDSSAQGLYTAVKKVFHDRSVPLSNIFGFGSDNCSTMMGVNSGFQALLKEDVPGVFIMGCVCHSFALCANHASKHLPSWLESLIKDICRYFARSSKRKHQFNLIQETVQAPAHRILKLAQTRWLSRGQVIARIMEQWDALLLFFQSEARSDRVDGAAKIHETMNTVGTKHMLLFLNYILPKVDKLNVEFQSQDFRLHKLYSSVCDEYRGILSMFIKDEVIQQKHISEIDPADTQHHMPTHLLHVGGRCEVMLVKQPLQEQEHRFRKDCLAFLVELCSQIKRRFPFQGDSVLCMLSCLNPQEALSTNRALTCISKLAMHFPQLVPEDQLDELEDQWRGILYAKNSTVQMSNSPTEFWDELKTVKDGNVKMKFGLLSNFMCNLLVLPHSSACVERIFSRVNMIKTPLTNRLHVSTVANRLLAGQAISRQGQECHSWEPSSHLVQDVQSGNCHKRYTNKQRQHQEEKTLHVYDVV